MVLLIATMWGVDGNLLSRIIESSGVCRRGHQFSEYRNYLDVQRIRSGLKDPIVFDIVYDNCRVSNKLIPLTKKLIVPCRPDLNWETMKKTYQIPESAFFNRLGRLKEMSRQPNSMVLPFEFINTQGGFDSLGSFLGTDRKFVADLEISKEVDVPMVRRYHKEINKISRLPSWFQKFA